MSIRSPQQSVPQRDLDLVRACRLSIAAVVAAPFMLIGVTLTTHQSIEVASVAQAAPGEAGQSGASAPNGYFADLFSMQASAIEAQAETL